MSRQLDTGSADDQPSQHECDEWGHCLHGDTAENRLLASISGKDWRGGWYGPVYGCPLCEAETAKTVAEAQADT